MEVQGTTSPVPPGFGLPNPSVKSTGSLLPANASCPPPRPAASVPLTNGQRDQNTHWESNVYMVPYVSTLRKCTCGYVLPCTYIHTHSSLQEKLHVVGTCARVDGYKWERKTTSMFLSFLVSQCLSRSLSLSTRGACQAPRSSGRPPTFCRILSARKGCSDAVEVPEAWEPHLHVKKPSSSFGLLEASQILHPAYCGVLDTSPLAAHKHLNQNSCRQRRWHGASTRNSFINLKTRGTLNPNP